VAFWWMNRAGSHWGHCKSDFVWVPEIDARGRPHPSRLTIAQIAPGDFILHYRSLCVQGLNIVTTSAQPFALPPEFPPEFKKPFKTTKGYFVPTVYQGGSSPVAFKDIRVAWRTGHSRSGPFDVEGDIKRRDSNYLFPRDDRFMTDLSSSSSSVLVKDFRSPSEHRRSSLLGMGEASQTPVYFPTDRSRRFPTLQQ
jgi:hypothetical protein